MNNKSILIFGGGLNQLTLIKAAKSLGVKSIVIDPNPNAPGKSIADHFVVVAPKDYEHTKAVAERFSVDGIVTAQMENPLALMAKLAAEKGYIFPSPDVIKTATNKWEMKAAFNAYGVPCAKGVLLNAEDDLSMVYEAQLDFPLIIKPLNAFSSRGVYRVENETELAAFRPKTAAFSKDGKLIVEEFLEGPEYSIEALTHQGHTEIIQYTEKFVTPFPYTVEMGHLQPADLTPQQRAAIGKAVKGAIEAVGLQNTASHTEVKWTPKGPKVVEIGPRLGGDFISSYLTLYSSGVNMDEAAIQIALGDRPEINISHEAYSYIRYFSEEPGRVVEEINSVEAPLFDEHVLFSHIFLSPEQIVPALTHSAERSGFVLVKGQTREEAMDMAKKASQTLKESIKLKNKLP